MQVRISVSSESQFLSPLSKLIRSFKIFLLQKRFRVGFELRTFQGGYPQVVFGMYCTKRMLARVNTRARVLALVQPLQVTVNYYSSEAG